MECDGMEKHYSYTTGSNLPHDRHYTHELRPVSASFLAIINARVNLLYDGFVAC